MKQTLIALTLFAAIATSAHAENPLPTDVCANGTYGLTRGVNALGPNDGFTDNEGRHVKEMDVAFDVTCGLGHTVGDDVPSGVEIVNVQITLSSGLPLESCDECRAEWDYLRGEIERANQSVRSY